MEQLQRPGLTRQQTQFSVDTSEQGQLKSEYALLQHKFERLAQKEKRLQVITAATTLARCRTGVGPNSKQICIIYRSWLTPLENIYILPNMKMLNL